LAKFADQAYLDSAAKRFRMGAWAGMSAAAALDAAAVSAD
jgi:hypothetical protein